MGTSTSQSVQWEPQAAPSGEPGPLRAGAAVRKITPDPAEKRVYLAGFGINRVATAVHDDLWVRALALSDGVTTIALAALDLIGLFQDDVFLILGEVSRGGISLQGAVIACTHTHSGPDTLGLWGPNRITSGVDRDYLAWVRAQTAEAIVEAIGGLRPARLRAASVPAPGLARNAREPSIVDDELSVLRAEEDDGTAIATVTNFPCHPEVLGNENTVITSDFPHFLRERIEATDGGTAIHFSGDLGGMMTPDVPAHTFVEAQRMGERLAERALNALADAPSLEVDRIWWRQRKFEVTLENPLLGMAHRTRLIHRHMIQADGRTLIETTASLLGLGGAQMLAVPGEVLPRLGLKLRALLPGPYRFLIGLANDELGYILDPSEFHAPANYFDPGDSYEERMSIGPEMGPALYATAQTLVQALRDME